MDEHTHAAPAAAPPVAQAAAQALSWLGGAFKAFGMGDDAAAVGSPPQAAAVGRPTQAEQSRRGAAEGVDWGRLDAAERHAVLELIGRSARDLSSKQLASLAGWPLFAYDTPRPEYPSGCGPLPPEGHRWHRP
eukprot:2329754-Prymnesium_polylepis.1